MNKFKIKLNNLSDKTAKKLFVFKIYTVNQPKKSPAITKKQKDKNCDHRVT